MLLSVTYHTFMNCVCCYRRLLIADVMGIWVTTFFGFSLFSAFSFFSPFATFSFFSPLAALSPFAAFAGLSPLAAFLSAGKGRGAREDGGVK